MPNLETVLTVPDLWQQKAINLLRSGHDVIVNAPTGSGKTLIFENFVEHNFNGKAVFTVPTRALANDKLREWTARGWNVGIETGDVSHNTKAPIIVATLETQKRNLIARQGPHILVIDEYQMLGDSARGLNYELAIAMAPKGTQLLLLSGSVANAAQVERWLKRCGRNAVCVNHSTRPVPLDEVHMDALPNRISKSIHGRWPRYIARALSAGFGPILIFAPRRKTAESLAHTLSGALGEVNPIALTAEQQAIAGTTLTRCIKNRIAFHHSGMSYSQRAGIVEPLAKNSQLKVIIATTGLASGINFSMRSVLILDREYRFAELHRQLRPDELLQMFGRAGRRGMDDKGSVLYLDGKPRLMDGRQLRLQRDTNVDWPSLIAVIQAAIETGIPPLKATRELTRRLFSNKLIRLGLDDFLEKRITNKKRGLVPISNEQPISGGTITEFKNSAGIWERKRAPICFPLKDTLLWDGKKWRPGLSTPKIPTSLRIGTICKFENGTNRRYGIEAPIALFPKQENENRLLLSKWVRKALRNLATTNKQISNTPKLWTLEKIERQLIPKLPLLTQGGKNIHLIERNNTLYAQLDYQDAKIHAFKDLEGKGLLNPIERKRVIAGSDNSEQRILRSDGSSGGRTITEQWFEMGLINEEAQPTRRGIIFSFFNNGEGLAIAAALEEKTYPIEELVYDLANIRAGHRFHALALAGRPLASISQNTYGIRSIPGYLRRGLPEDYGDGASEVLYNIENKNSRAENYINDELSRGDIERAKIEWRSLCGHISYAPTYEWQRWQELQSACQKLIISRPVSLPFENLPQLTAQQKRPSSTLISTF